MTGILTKRKERGSSEQTQPERIPCAYKRGSWNNVSARQERPGDFQHQKLGSFLLVFEGFTARPIPWLQTSSPQKCKRINFCYFKLSTSVSVCYRHPRKRKIVYTKHLEPVAASTRRCYHVYHFSLHSDKKQLRRRSREGIGGKSGTLALLCLHMGTKGWFPVLSCLSHFSRFLDLGFSQWDGPYHIQWVISGKTFWKHAQRYHQSASPRWLQILSNWQ